MSRPPSKAALAQSLSDAACLHRRARHRAAARPFAQVHRYLTDPSTLDAALRAEMDAEVKTVEVTKENLLVAADAYAESIIAGKW